MTYQYQTSYRVELLWGKACNTPKRENRGIQTIPLLPSPIQPTYLGDTNVKHQQSDSALSKQAVNTFFFSFSTLTDLIKVVYEKPLDFFEPQNRCFIGSNLPFLCCNVKYVRTSSGRAQHIL